MKCFKAPILLISFMLLATQAFATPAKTVGIVMDGSWGRYGDLKELFINDIKALSTDKQSLRFPADKQLSGNGQATAIRAALKQLLSDPEVDIVLALGFSASNIAPQLAPLSKPVFAPFLFEPLLEKGSRKGFGSPIKNLNYVSIGRELEGQLINFRRLTTYRALAIMIDQSLYDAMPGLKTYARTLANEFTMEVQLIPVANDVDQALNALPADTDAVYVGPLPQLSQENFTRLVDQLISRKLPSYSSWGYDEVAQGLLAGSSPADEKNYISRTIGLNLMEVLRGKKPEQIAVAHAGRTDIYINMETARAIGVYPDWALMTEAKLLNAKRAESGRWLDLNFTIQEALVANRDLAALDRGVSAGSERIKETRGQLLPQLDLSASYLVIDEDQARSSQGLMAEKTLSGRARFSQLLYADSVWAGYSIEKYAQMGREEGLNALRLDITQQAAVGYLNVLRARTSEQVQRDNLKLTRANLERARIRLDSGAASPAEVYRWESEIANRQQSVLQAESNTLATKQELNRLLNRPLSEDFYLNEGELDDPLILIKDRRLFSFLNNTQTIHLLREYLVKSGLSMAPELKQFNSLLAANERNLTAANRDYWLPTFSFEGSLEKPFTQNGEGSNGLLSSDEKRWSAGLVASLPLLKGGSRPARVRRIHEEIAQIRFEKSATAERIEQRIQQAVNLLRASYPSIRLSRLAAEAAASNLNLVTDSYAEGVLSIIDLLDAQNLALTSQLSAANAANDFMIDLMLTQRAIGEFVLLFEPQERTRWFDDATQFFLDAGVKL